ncbi:MAG: FG-GAP-like repeat-containing protein [Chloroflexota bacterium]
MRTYCLILLAFLAGLPLRAIEVKNDNGVIGGSINGARPFWEESTVLIPDGPCFVNYIAVCYAGDVAGPDTLHIVGMPTAGNIYPTQYIWDYNSLVEPIIYQYDGIPGWKTIDVSKLGLRSDGYDKIVVQHIIKPNGPWFSYDANGRSSALSWRTDPYTPNHDFYDIIGTISEYAQGDYMVRLDVNYIYPEFGRSALPPTPTLVDVTTASGIAGGGEISIADWNNDGWDDIAIGSNFFQNNGDRTFTNVSSKMKISAGGTSWGDIDGDGDLDCYAMVNGAYLFEEYTVINNDRIYINNGDGTFTPKAPKDIFRLPYPDPIADFKSNKTHVPQDSIANPYPACTPTWLDVNGDGKLDLFIANKRIEVGGKGELFTPDELWLNMGDGTFRNISVKAGLRQAEPFVPGTSGYQDCYGASACDYNSDGKTDIFVATYRLAPDVLMKNNGDTTFTNVAATTGVQGRKTADPGYFGHGMGSEWGDFNNDGYADLCVGNLAHTDQRGVYSNPSLIFMNKGPAENYAFEDVGRKMGIKFHEGNAGVCWLDLDLDGYLDLWHGKYSGGIGSFYINQGPPDYKLVEITWKSGAIVQNPWEAVRLDYDHDGDMDILVAGRLFENRLMRNGSWIAFRLRGNPAEQVSTEAYGSKIYVYSKGKLFFRELNGSSAGTHSNQNSNELHFGLGYVDQIDSAIVAYPNGKRLKLVGLKANARYTVNYMGTAAQFGLATPQPISPANGAMKVPKTPYLIWSVSEGAEKYQYQLSIFEDFATIDNMGYFTSAENTLQKELTEGLVYFWRVRAIRGADTTIWSSPAHFYVGIPISDVALLAPANNSTKQSVQPYFSWKIAGTTSNIVPRTIYNIELYGDSLLTDKKFSLNGIRDPNYQLSEIRLQPGASYYWRVSSAFGENSPSGTSQTFHFTTLPLPAKAILTSPANLDSGVARNVPLKWEAIPDANSYDLQIALDKDFSQVKYDRQNLDKLEFIPFPKFATGQKYFWRVRAVNSSGTGEWSEVRSFIVEGTLSVVDAGNADFEIYPNPATEELNVELHNPVEAGTILIITDLSGKQLYEAQITASLSVIPTKYLPSGTYFATIRSRAGETAMKIEIRK